MTTSVPVIEGLFSEGPEGARLLGSKCATCGTPYFPKSAACHNPECSQSKMEDASFGPRGRLWSCSIQNFPPPAPARYDEPYKPYAVGVVDLREGLRVVGRISTDDPESVKPGAEVELVLEPLCRDEDGRQVITWMFKEL